MTPFIEFHVSPKMPFKSLPEALLVNLEMGRYTDSTWLEAEGSRLNQNPSASLLLQDVGKEELRQYTNVKIVLSTGKSKAKSVGYVPI